MVEKPVWIPSQARIEQANLTRFIREVSQSHPQVTDFPSLYQWSVSRPADFWSSIWDFCEVRYSRPWDEVVAGFDQMPGARWFPGARLNFAENLLRFDDQQTALVFWNERGRQRSLTYAQLHQEVSCLAAALTREGVKKGDRVAGFLPNMPETVIAMLAAASLGCIWSSCSPDFGVKGVMDRFGQIEPKIMFAADGYRYAGKQIDSLQRVRGLARQLRSLKRLVIVPYQTRTPELGGLPKAVTWEAFRETVGGPPKFAQLPFDHPLYIMYSSGTTGLPKCMAHGAGGTLIQHLKELVLHTDLSRSDVIFYATTCGWMMWNWLVSSLAVGATLVLYDGSPFHPNEGILFEMAEQEGVSIFGTSAKYLALAEKRGLEPINRFDLEPLRSILSTGSPLAPQSYEYVYQKIKEDLCLSSISGGTDLISCFALGNPIGPVYRGELQTRGLGMKVEIFDPQGNPVTDRPGELVCTQPFPSMPIYFWNDPSGEKYRKAYFQHFDGVWRHGDWAELTPRGGLVIYGRSDATLNPGGVRIGTAEIYRQVEQLEEVVESLVVDQEWEGDVRIILFVRLQEGLQLDEGLKEHIRSHIRSNTSPHHVPKKIIQVTDIPRTISGKITELAVRNAIHGLGVENVDALANPEALDLFRDLPELAS